MAESVAKALRQAMPSLPTDLETLWYLSEWIVRIGALAVVPSRRSPSAARAWLLFIFFLPVPAILLYMAIGRPHFPAWRIARFRKLQPYFAQCAQQLRPHVPDLGTSEPIAALAANLGQMPATGGNRIALLDDYDGVIARLVADIDAASASVHLFVYIFADDAVGRQVAAALGRAAKRGLEVRVLFDPVGSRPWRRGTRALLDQEHLTWREALPFRLLRGRTRQDMRYHRKLFVIDGRIGYAGSLNIVAKDFRPGVVNRELVARVEGPVVASMAAQVEGDWSLETGVLPATLPIVPEAVGNAQAQLLPSGASYRLEGFETLLVWQIHQARERIIIVTPYFVPDEDVLGALCAAVARGVAVDLVLSQIADQRLVNLSQSSFYDDLLAAGVGLNLFPDYLLHAKNLSIDGRFAVVGSSNVDLRSFQLNEEASLLL